MLYIGEKVGAGGPKIDIALDPLEGTTITAKGGQNALAVIAMAEQGGFLNAPDTYMDKIAIGSGLPDGVVDLDAGPEENLKQLARAKRMEIADLVACILDRPRHTELISRVRAAGAKNIIWVFHIQNYSYPSDEWNQPKGYYPGDDYVDWLAMSAYGKQFWHEE